MSSRSLLDTLAGTTTPTMVIADNTTATRTTPITTPSLPISPSKLSGISVDIVPYNAVYDPQASDFLAWMWKKMQEDDLVDYYFPGQKETGYAQFVRMMSGDANVGLVVTKVDSDQWNDKVAGFISWTPMHLGSVTVAVAGFIFFRQFWDHHTTDDAGKVAFKFWFTETDSDQVLGVCPSTHAAAVRYNKRIGLREVGRLLGAHLFKGEKCDAVLYVITKEAWAAQEDNQ